MTTLAFCADNGLAEIFVNETTEIRIVGGAISAGGPVLAHHANGAWHVGSQRLERITCKGRVCVEFLSKTGPRSFGPFDELSLTDDVAVTPAGILARYQPLEESWYFDRYESQADALVVKEAPNLLAA